MGILSFQNDLLMANPHLETASGAIATFNTNFKAPLKSLKVNIEPVQSGSGDPSPTNVRPITGWTGANVYCVGKNRAGEMERGTTSGSSATGSTYAGIKTSSTTRLRPKELYYVGQGSFTISWDSTNFDVAVDGFDAEQRYLGKTNAFLNWESTSPLYMTSNKWQNAIYIAVILRKKNNGTITIAEWENANLQVEVGATATEYEPYQGTTYPISWETEAGTVYGGTATYNGDGTWTITRKATIYTFDGSTTKLSYTGTNISHNGTTYYNYYYISSAGETWDKKSMWVSSSFDYSWCFKCSHAPTVFVNEAYEDATLLYSAYIGSSKVLQPRLVFNSSTGIDTLAKANSFLATQYENGTPVVIAYPLKTATVTTITTEELIYTLKGENNIWADCGEVEVKYWKH